MYVDMGQFRLGVLEWRPDNEDIPSLAGISIQGEAKRSIMASQGSSNSGSRWVSYWITDWRQCGLQCNIVSPQSLQCAILKSYFKLFFHTCIL